MGTKRDYYDVLGIGRNADGAAIKTAYRKLAKQYHPDTNAGNPQAEQKFKEVTEAYEVLSDPEKKKLYDQFGHAAFDGSGPALAAQLAAVVLEDSADSAVQMAAVTGNIILRAGIWMTYSAICLAVCLAAGELQRPVPPIPKANRVETIPVAVSAGAVWRRQRVPWSSFHGDHFGSGPFSAKGADLNTEVEVTFDEAAFGCDKIVRLKREDGSIQSLQVHIPAGIEDGKTIRLRAKACPGRPVPRREICL